MTPQLLNAGCGTHYAPGWVNTDVWAEATPRLDVLCRPGEPYPFEDNTFDAVYLGHVLEHIPWPQVPAFLADMARVAKPGAAVLVVGPDVHRSVRLWADSVRPRRTWSVGLRRRSRAVHEDPVVPWSLLEAVLEHQIGLGWASEPGAHHWNCHASRVADLLRRCGFADVEDVSDAVTVGDGWSDRGVAWPTVGYAAWQCAVRATVPVDAARPA